MYMHKSSLGNPYFIILNKIQKHHKVPTFIHVITQCKQIKDCLTSFCLKSTRITNRSVIVLKILLFRMCSMYARRFIINRIRALCPLQVDLFLNFSAGVEHTSFVAIKPKSTASFPPNPLLYHIYDRMK